MKKKKFLLILIPVFILVLILFLPIPVGTTNDGGSRDFQALTYRLVRWNRIIALEDGTVDYYTKWSFYPIPLCYESIDTLWENESGKCSELQIASRKQGFHARISEIRQKGLLVNGLDSNSINYRGAFSFSVKEETELLKENEKIQLSDLKIGDVVYVEFTGETMESYPAQISNVTRITLISSSGELSYKDSYVRVDGCGENAHVFRHFSKNNAEADGWNRLPIIAIESKESLDEMITGLKLFEQYTTTLWSDTALFTDFPTIYDETFFKEKALLLVYIAESSGSNTHKIHSCYVSDGICTVIVESIVPESGDCDMAGWLVCLEVEKDDVANLSFDAYRFRK